ncbi:MAG: LytTR family transcriptional regulator DNA-binding domain-containing protein [Bacteroidales bacterium]|jgi:two-component system LytT family response regulator
MNTKLKALIIDDEEPARVLIRSYLDSFPDIQVTGECANGFEGLKAIQSDKPDLVFLDIQMPKISGFELLELLDDFPQVIFSTAFDEYAIKAFEYNAVDYLLKPYSRERFSQAVTKAIERINKKSGPAPGLSKIAGGTLPEGIYLDRIVVKTGQKIKVVAIDQVEYLEAEDDYVMIYTGDGRYLKQMTMGYFEEHLDPAEFIRVHRSHIVKIAQIVQLEPYDKETKVLVMKSGKKIHTSKAGMKRLREVLGF